ncbi:MAG: hypothetical protein A2Y10_08640 [Planctomycetes bacterium GWF2_41_51]|nr:MAG: hypothetical protein A2Y10_08640 [Planctomycetes bacterium GWF2_41_51]HBG28600.1 hypothetical protein [Phycisphaerales bacterium]
MKVKTITLEGDTGYIATISREDKSIVCHIADKNGTSVNIHLVSPDDRDDQYSMSQCIQYQLDGCRGTNSMIHSYFRFIELFAD